MTTPQTPLQPTADELIEGFAVATVRASGLMHSNRLNAHLLVIIYSAIDSMGLLDAAPTVDKATGASFKGWVTKYLLPQKPSFAFNEVDLWAARCAVLHTFTSESDLSKNGNAKQIHYYGGDTPTESTRNLIAAIPTLEGGGKHVAANLDDIATAFMHGVKQFADDLSKNCASDPRYEARLRKVIQQYQV